MATWAKTGQAWGGGSDGRHKGKTNNKKRLQMFSGTAFHFVIQRQACEEKIRAWEDGRKASPFRITPSSSETK